MKTAPISGIIEHLYISSGHNYFGHHGQAAGVHAVTEVLEVECLAGRGLRHDRFLDYEPNYKGQITFFSMETFEAMCADLNLIGFSPGALRRNVYTRGLDWDDLIGKEFSFQGVRFAGSEECHPCYWMDQALAAGAEAWLQKRGGLRARILSDGWLHCKQPQP